MSWERNSYTTVGAAMLSESISGGSLTITRAVSGTGTADTDLSEETAVTGDLHDLVLLGINTTENNGQPARKVDIGITGATESYIMHQIGVYGCLNDDEEALLFLMQDDRGIEIPASSSNASFGIELSVLLSVSNKANISLTVDPQVQALMKLVKAEIEKHNSNPDAHAEIITEATSKALKELEASGEIMSEEQVLKLIRENSGGGGSGGGKKYDITLAADGWQLVPEEDGEKPYQYIYDAELPDSTSKLFACGAASVDSFLVTSRAGVLPGCETYDGFVRFFAQRIPEADIPATLVLFGNGGDSNDSGEVSIGQGLKRDETGAIAVNIGEGLDFDSANALTVRKETVMTSEDLLDEEETKQEIVDMLK